MKRPDHILRDAPTTADTNIRRQVDFPIRLDDIPMANLYIQFDQPTAQHKRVPKLLKVLFCCCFVFILGLMPGFTKTITTIFTVKDMHTCKDNCVGVSEADDYQRACDGIGIASETDYNTHLFIGSGLFSFPSNSTIISAKLVVNHQNWSYWVEDGGSVTLSARRITESRLKENDYGTTASGSEVNWFRQPVHTRAGCFAFYAETAGLAPYTNNWPTMGGGVLNTTSEGQIGLSAGTYSVTVADANGCTKPASVMLDYHKVLPFALGAINNN